MKEVKYLPYREALVKDKEVTSKRIHELGRQFYKSTSEEDKFEIGVELTVLIGNYRVYTERLKAHDLLVAET